MVEKMNDFFDNLVEKATNQKNEVTDQLIRNYISSYINALISCKEDIVNRYISSEASMKLEQEECADFPELLGGSIELTQSCFNSSLEMLAVAVNNWTKSKYLPNGVILEKISLNQFKY
jgi:hypothetical protein